MKKSQLWSQIKSFGNPDKLSWQSPMTQMSEAVENYNLLQELLTFQDFQFKPEVIKSYTETTVDKKEGNGERLKQFILEAPANSILVVNKKQFTYTGNVNALIGQIFDEIDYLEELELETIYNEVVYGEEDDQIYYFGDSNCLITPIRKLLIEKHMNAASESYKLNIKKIINRVELLVPKFNAQGATPELIQNLADATDSKITVYEVINQTKRIFKAQKVQRKFKFKFQNISLNHVELWSGKNEEIILDNLDDIIERLTETRQTYKFQKVNGYIVKINTGLQTYIDKDYKALLDAENEINDNTLDLTLTLNATDKAAGLQILLDTIQTCGGKQFGQETNPETLKHIDAVQSYSQFQSLPPKYRHGFAYLTDYRKVSSVDFAIKHNGFYKLQINSTLPAHIQAILGVKAFYVLASNIIQYLNDNKVQMTIDGGIYGKHSKHIQLTPSVYQKHCDRKAYYTAFSKYGIVSDSITENICCPDYKLAQIISHNVGHRMITTGATPPTYSIIIKKQEKKNIKTRLHVYGYVLQCQMLNLMLQLEKMDMNKVKLIFGDDIYYQEHQFEKLDIFRQKDNNIYKDLIKIADPEFLRIPHFNEWAQYNFGEEEAIYYQYQLHSGPGGFGKTFKRLQDKGSINQIYTTLTNKLVNEQRNSIFKPKCYTTAMFQAKYAQFKITATNIIIDEIGLCEDGIIKFIKEKMPYARIYVLGDELQISGQLSNPFDPSLYDLILDETNFTTDYRAMNCPKLQLIKKQIRTAMREGQSEQQIFTNIVIPNSHKTTVNQWVKQYNENKMIVTCSNEQKDIWTERLGDQYQKYRVTKSFVHNAVQYYTGDLLTQIPDGFDYEKNIKLKHPHIKKQFGFTCHSLQGCTHDDQLLIQSPINIKLFRGYCYTAVSRLTKIQDLYTLMYKTKESN